MQPARKLHCRPALFGSRSNTASFNTLAAGGMLSLLTALPLSANAQTPQAGRMPNLPRPSLDSPAGMQTGLSLNISAESAPYHLDWNGSSGTLTRRALAGQPEIRLPLTYLHSEPGPKGYSKYLAWFLARDKDHFSLVWCYFNDAGREFYCWLYQFPTNQLTTLRFTGDYRFVPQPEPLAPVALPELNTRALPSYTGPDFKYRDWTRRMGQLASLDLQPVRASYAAALTDEGTENRAQGTGQSAIGNSAKTLSGLRVYPLHEIQVAKGNGWRAGGWRELHALAMDSANDPYYLILYSNVTKGYVVDLKRGQTYAADFGAKVNFSNDNTVFGAKEETVVGPPDARIRRYARVEIPLVSTIKYDNPYNNVQVYMDFHSPEGKTVTVPGFWDGDQTWRVRFTPTQVGKWSWRSYSTDTELGNQVGSFTCVSDEASSKGFVTVNAQRFYPHTFASANGQPFFPVFLRDPVHYFPAPDTTIAPATVPKAPAKARPAETVSLIAPMQDSPANGTIPPGSGTNDPTLPDMSAATTPRTFVAFARRVDDAAALGYNRFWGGWLLDPALFPQHTQANEGGAPFINYDLNTVNPAYFQWMDRRIAYCNERGIVPDIGITDIGSNLLTDLKPEQVGKLWQYALARYASFNVNWNLFGKSPDNPYPPDVDAWVEPLAKMTDKYDPNGHPLTTVVPNAAPQTPMSTPPANPTIIRPDGPVVFRPDVPNTNGFIPDSSGGIPQGFNPPVTPPAAPSTGVPGTGVPGIQAPNNPGGTGDPTAAGNGSNTGRRNRNQRGNTNAGNNAGGTSAGAGSNRGTTGRSASGRGTSGATGAGRSNAAGNNANASAGRGNSARGNTTGPGTGTFPGAFGANPQAQGFPSFPAGGSGFPNRSAFGGAGMGQNPFTDPRFQDRTGRQRGGRGRTGTGGTGMDSSGTYTGVSAITGNTTASDYVTIVDPQVAAALRSDIQAQHPTGHFVSTPIVRYANSTWLDVITLSGGDLSALTSDYRLNKPLVVQDVTGKEPTDEARHRMWETIMRGGFWQGAVSSNTGVADPLNSAPGRWQLAASRLLQKTQQTRLLPHQDMLGGVEENGFDRRRRKRAQAEAAAANGMPMPAAPSGSGSVPSAQRGSAPLPEFTGEFDENGDPIFSGGFNFVPQPAPVVKKAAPGAIYVLADPGWEYVVYFSSGGSVTLDLLEATGTLRQSWFNPRTGEYASEDTMQGGVYKTFNTPDANDWVLLLSRR